MKKFQLAIAAACMTLSACRLPASLTEGPPPDGVVSVRELLENRRNLKGQVVRVEGFLMEEQQTFVLVEGRPREVGQMRDGYASWCLDWRATEPLWIPKRDLRRLWWSVRPRSLFAGVHVVLEGVFDDENRPLADGEGRSNESILTGARDAPFVPGQYHGMGPLRNAHAIRLFPDRCEGLGPSRAPGAPR